MKASSDKSKGATHLEQLVLRNPLIGDDVPVTLEVLSDHTKVRLDDMITIYNKKSDKPYEPFHEIIPTGLDLICKAVEKLKAEDSKAEDKAKAAVKREEHSVLPLPAGPPPLIRQKGYYWQGHPHPKPPALSHPVSREPSPPPPLSIPVNPTSVTFKDDREFDEEALLKVYEFVNRVERWMLREIKTQPTPKSLSSKYESYMSK